MTTRIPRAVAAVLALTALLLGPTAGGALADSSIPITAVFSGSAGFASPTQTVFVGSGTASHMGAITTNGHADVTGFDNSCSGGVANINTETLTAADGSTLTVVSNDVACPTGPGQYHGTGHWTVVGGTGRFAGTTGSGSLDGQSDFIVGTFDVRLTGQISN